MNPCAREWVEKAEGDYETGKRELRARKHPNYDAACFHAQQCAEKYMKAVLTECGRDFKKQHDLAVLLDALRGIDSTWELLRPVAVTLTDYDVKFRYPGNSADKAMAREALQACEVIRDALRNRLGLNRPIARKKKRKTARRKR